MPLEPKPRRKRPSDIPSTPAPRSLRGCRRPTFDLRLLRRLRAQQLFLLKESIVTTAQESTPAQKSTFRKSLLIATLVGVAITLLLRLTPLAAGPRMAIGFFAYVLIQEGLLRMWTRRMHPGWPGRIIVGTVISILLGWLIAT